MPAGQVLAKQHGTWHDYLQLAVRRVSSSYLQSQKKGSSFCFGTCLYIEKMHDLVPLVCQHDKDKALSCQMCLYIQYNPRHNVLVALQHSCFHDCQRVHVYLVSGYFSLRIVSLPLAFYVSVCWDALSTVCCLWLWSGVRLTIHRSLFMLAACIVNTISCSLNKPGIPVIDFADVIIPTSSSATLLSPSNPSIIHKQH